MELGFFGFLIIVICYLTTLSKIFIFQIFLLNLGNISMNSFNAIGATQSTNLAAVAPGVAEALLTTAVGLIAAIPAVVAYNKLTNDIDRMAQRMETFSGELGAILSRQSETTEEE